MKFVFLFGELAILIPLQFARASDARWDWRGQSSQLAKNEPNVAKKRTNHLPQYSSPVQLTPNGPRRPRTASERLIMRPLAPSRPAYTPWGYCDRLGWSVVTCGCHPQPSRRPRALKVAAAGSGQRRRGGVLRVTRVTTTGTRVVGRGPGTSARTIRHSYRVVEHEFYEKSKKN